MLLFLLVIIHVYLNIIFQGIHQLKILMMKIKSGIIQIIYRELITIDEKGVFNQKDSETNVTYSVIITLDNLYNNEFELK